MGGADNIRGLTLQLAAACELGVRVALNDDLTALHVEGADEIADLEVVAGDRVASVVQVKSRAEHRLIGPSDLADLVRRFAAMPERDRAERFELITDTGLTKDARASILSPAQSLAEGRDLDQATRERLERLGLVDVDDVLRCLTVRPRYGDPQYVLDRATVAILDALGNNQIEANQVRERLTQLFTELTVRGGQGVPTSRVISADEIRSLLQLVPRSREARRLELEARAISRIPHPDPTLIPRPELTAPVRAALTGSDAPALVALVGLPGAGKTEFAIELANTLKDLYCVVWWVNAEHLATAFADLRQLLGRLTTRDTVRMDDDRIPELTLAALANHAPWLLVLDNIDGPAALRQLGLASHGDVLLTSRNPAWSSWGATQEVGLFSDEQAVDLLMSRNPTGDRQEATGLAEDLGYLPLAVAQAAAYIELSTRGFANFRRLFAERFDVLDDGRSVLDAQGRYAHSIVTTLDLLLEQFDDEETIVIAGLLAQFGAEPVPRALLSATVSEARLDWLDEVAVDRALIALARAAVIRQDDSSVTMHRLTARAVRRRLPSAQSQELRNMALLGLDAVFPADALDTGRWALGAALLPHAHVVLRSPGVFMTVAASRLAARVCALDHIQGRLDSAVTLARHALDQLPADSDPRSRADLLHALGRTGLKNGELDPAVDPLSLALRSLDELGERETLQYAAIETTLGAILSELAHEEAAGHLEHALGVQRALLPPDDKRIARTLLEIGADLSTRGQNRAALRYEEEALAIVDRPDLHAGVDLARGLGNYAGTLSEIPERRADALTAAQRALDVTREVYGEEHPEVAYPLTSLASLVAEDDTERAYELLQLALRLRLDAFGAHHEQVAYTLACIGRTFADAGEPERALVWLQQAYELLRDLFHDGHIEVAAAAADLGNAMAALGRSDQARPLLVGALDGIEQAWGRDHPDARLVREALLNLGHPE